MRQPAWEHILAMDRRRTQAWADAGTMHSQTRQLDPPVCNLILPFVLQSQHLLCIIQDLKDSKIHAAICTCRKPAEQGKKWSTFVSRCRPHQATRYIFGVFRRHKTLLSKFPFLEIFSSYFAAPSLLTLKISAGFSS